MTAKLYVFTDASFANNKDLNSQIGYIIVLANETPINHYTDHPAFRIKGNIIYWSSIKCKRITKSVLASEIYKTVYGFDIGYYIF